MELKLNIYTDRKCKEIEKTLVANDFELSTGICEDIMSIVDIDLIEGGEALSEESQVIEVMKIVVRSFSTFKVMLKEVFDDLTDEEIGRTKMKEIAFVVVQILKFAIKNLFSAFGGSKKN